MAKKHKAKTTRQSKQPDIAPVAPWSVEDESVFTNALITFEVRGEEWAAYDDRQPIKGRLYAQIVEAGLLRPNDDFAVRVVVGFFHDLMWLGFTANRLPEEKWSNPDLVRYIKYVVFELPVLARSLANYCEEVGIDSSPLMNMAIAWTGFRRSHDDPKDLLVNFRECFDEVRIAADITATTGRLLRRTENAAYGLIQPQKANPDSTQPSPGALTPNTENLPGLSRRARRIVVLLQDRSVGDLITGPDLAALYQKMWKDDAGLSDQTLTGGVLDEIREHFEIINVKKKGYSLPADSPARRFEYLRD